ncbi:MAG: hypothetical protein A2889_03205 [Nitrospinae bacterium RIFCSPLOWO2_01_FULL_39_10]|nr:MAG: hypothetical protein A2889_03205 [Nitrospinae bacterium RIFCSPLOWO2_01_FULL_39_10]
MRHTTPLIDKLESTKFIYNDIFAEEGIDCWIKDTIDWRDDYLQGKTNAISENLKDQIIYEPSKPLIFTEEIVQWWIGRVEEVKEDYFFASLRDLRGVESIAEIDISSVSEDQLEYVLVGAEFAYYVSRENRREGRRIVSKIEFNTPYLWTEKDQEKTEKLIEELFPEETSL